MIGINILLRAGALITLPLLVDLIAEAGPLGRFDVTILLLRVICFVVLSHFIPVLGVWILMLLIVRGLGVLIRGFFLFLLIFSIFFLLNSIRRWRVTLRGFLFFLLFLPCISFLTFLLRTLFTVLLVFVLTLLLFSILLTFFLIPPFFSRVFGGRIF